MVLEYVNGNFMKQNKNNLLDEYFTKPNVSNYLFEKTKEIISKYEDIENYTWIEPSVGDGSFYKILPENKIGIDINETAFNTLQINYLNYKLPQKKIIVIGNPPFGHRGVLALEFINHSQQADFVVNDL